MGNLIERLRGPCPSIPAMRDAADEINKLRHWKAAYESLREELTAERDALRARIEGAPTTKVRGKVGEICMAPVSHDLMGKRVALVVIE